LSETQITKTNVAYKFDWPSNRWHGRKEACSLLESELKDFRDVPPFISDSECLLIESPAVADFTVDIDIRKKAHGHLEGPMSLARLATSACYIKRKTTRLVSPYPAFRGQGKEPSYV
jgi:hypothetical protein